MIGYQPICGSFIIIKITVLISFWIIWIINQNSAVISRVIFYVRSPFKAITYDCMATISFDPNKKRISSGNCIFCEVFYGFQFFIIR